MLLARDLPQIKIPDAYLAQDVDAGKDYVERSAYLGFSKAQLKMGAAYELCALNCEFNPALSLHYNALAARQGEPEAELAISKWFICGQEGVFSKNEELAFKYAQRAAQQGLPTAEFAMGYFYEIGWFMPKDTTQAQEWYQKAAKSGNKEAIEGLKRLSNSQTLSMKDHEKVAMPRIKSTHGSKRGQRPPRLTRPVNQMPTVPDEASPTQARPPPVRQQYSRPHHSLPPRVGTAEPLPPRASSVAPYPMEDRPATAAPNGPYPSLYPSPHHAGATPGGFHGSDRRPTSEVGDPRSNPGPSRNRPYPPNGPPMRGPSPIHSYHSAADLNASRPLPNPQRYPSASPTAGYNGPPGAQPPMRPPKAPLGGPPHPVPPAASPTPPPQRADMMRPAFASRPSYESTSARPNASPAPFSSQGTSAYGSGPLRLNPDSITPSRPAFSSRPSINDPAPKPPNMSHPSQPVNRPGQAGGTQQAAPTRPAGKGPKTFEEMGVPNSKNDGECVSLGFISIFMEIADVHDAERDVNGPEKAGRKIEGEGRCIATEQPCPQGTSKDRRVGEVLLTRTTHKHIGPVLWRFEAIIKCTRR